MKKIILLFVLAAFVASQSAFAKKKKVDYDSEVQQSEKEEREKSEKKSAAKERKIYRFGKDYAVQKGLVRMETVRESGAVLFYVVNGKRVYPAVETSGYGQSNYISFYLGGKEYRLNKKGIVSYHYDIDDNSITETFTVKGVAELIAKYEISKMDPKDEKENSILVSYSFKNLTGKTRVFVLKSVYNLCLGENRKDHYSSALKSDISGEYVAFPSKEESWIISSDSQNAVEVILFGKGVTPAKKAVLANKDVIEMSNPSTSFTPGNSFDSIMSYNNSSLALYWDAVELDDQESVDYSYRINFSVSDFQNSGKGLPLVAEKAEPENDVEEDAEKKDELPSDQLKGEIDYIDPSKLNEEYVQQLINHINSLEQSDPSLNRMKIQQLQTEVDEVLQVLRSHK